MVRQQPYKLMFIKRCILKNNRRNWNNDDDDDNNNNNNNVYFQGLKAFTKFLSLTENWFFFFFFFLFLLLLLTSVLKHMQSTWL